MFNFGKSKLPANWPPLHHKCNRSKCAFPNYPQPAPGTYKCRGCEKGTYTVSLAQAKEVDAHNRSMFQVTGRSLPPNRMQQKAWDLNEEFPPYTRGVEPKKPNHPSRANVHTTTHGVVRGYAQAPSSGIRDPRSVYPHGINPNVSQQMYSSSSYTLASTPSRQAPPHPRGPHVPVERVERRQARPYRVMNH
ncbi:hypothetical protein FB446DRAFT_783640 [Lentinula raphanica]|nr:hypothetical protein FB446DRAFT_783640 [Lentinula raphanica]